MTLRHNVATLRLEYELIALKILQLLFQKIALMAPIARIARTYSWTIDILIIALIIISVIVATSSTERNKRLLYINFNSQMFQLYSTLSL